MTERDVGPAWPTEPHEFEAREDPLDDVVLLTGQACKHCRAPFMDLVHRTGATAGQAAAGKLPK